MGKRNARVNPQRKRVRFTKEFKLDAVRLLKRCATVAGTGHGDAAHPHRTERTHQGKMCCGRTPMPTMLAGKEIYDQKTAALN